MIQICASEMPRREEIKCNLELCPSVLVFLIARSSANEIETGGGRWHCLIQITLNAIKQS